MELHIESEQNNIPVADLIILAFNVQQSLLPGVGQSPHFYKIIIKEDFRPDESFFHVAVDLSGSDRGLCSGGDRPGAEFRTNRRIKSNETQQFITRPDQLMES